MLIKALHQLIVNTNWGELDFLILDMPPGTGDIHLTLCEKYKIDGVLIVSTPHELATADVSRVVDMYKKFSLPILGIIKNMSYVEIGGEKKYIFGAGEVLSSYSSRAEIPIIEEISIDQNMSSFSAKDFAVPETIKNIAKEILFLVWNS